MFNQITSTPIIQSKWVPETIWVKRTWKERLFSLPWKPFQKMRETPGVYIVGGVIYCHPKRYAEIVSGLTPHATERAEA
jgi:hypothetical protein